MTRSRLAEELRAAAANVAHRDGSVVTSAMLHRWARIAEAGPGEFDETGAVPLAEADPSYASHDPDPALPFVDRRHGGDRRGA